MTKKNIRPQQVAPVQREATATSKYQSGQVTILLIPYEEIEVEGCGVVENFNPFAGDDAE